MRKLHLMLLLPLMAAVPALDQSAPAQSPIQPQVLYARQKQITIPFDPDPVQAHRLQQVQLYFSTDQGRSWRLGATSNPEQRKFSFQAETDGSYLFAVQTTDTTGRNFPEKMEGVTPGLRVVIDTMPPLVSLRPLPPRGAEVGVEWDIRDDNLDLSLPDAIRLEYRVQGGPWVPLYRIPGAVQHYWSPHSNGWTEVKLRARDLAGNATEANTQVSLSGQGNFANPAFNPGFGGGQLNVPLDPNRKFVNSKAITLNYRLDEAGPSGVASIDLWLTTDGRNWSKQHELPLSPGDLTAGKPLAFQVPGEGVYGITLIPKSGVGLSADPPKTGERPQIWIEADLTKPVVSLDKVEVGVGKEQGKLKLHWYADDKNLGKTPIRLSYSSTPESAADWKVMAADLPNTRVHEYFKPPGSSMPWQFYVKVEAIDLAGNIGEAISRGIIKMDPALPKAVISDVYSGGK